VFGVTFYLPSAVATILNRKIGFEVGLFAAIPWVCALVASYIIPSWSDRTGERSLTGALTLAIGGAGIFAASGIFGPWVSFIGLCLAASGFIAVQPIFFTFPTGYLAGAATAGGLGFINSLAALGGFVAPNLRVMIESAFNSSRAGLYALSGLTFFAALMMACFPLMGFRSARAAPEAGAIIL
jgi:hypothetical protein